MHGSWSLVGGVYSGGDFCRKLRQRSSCQVSVDDLAAWRHDTKLGHNGGGKRSADGAFTLDAGVDMEDFHVRA